MPWGGGGPIPVAENAVSSNGAFSIDFPGDLPGFAFYGLSVSDKDNRSSQTKVYKVDLSATAFARQNVSLPPTVGTLRNSVTRGDFVVLEGYGSPHTQISAFIDNVRVGSTVPADETGYYRFLYNTSGLKVGIHTGRVRQINSDRSQSDSSLTIDFIVSRVLIVQTDLNGDGVVDARDASIFISRWYSKDSSVYNTIDFNHDGVVDIKDFSIFTQSLSIKL